MARTRKLTVEIAGETKGLKSALGTADKQVSGLGGKFAGLSAKAKVALAGTAAAVGVFAKASINEASSLAESMSKVGVVFGDQAAAVKQFSERAATNLGMSQQAALEATGTFGNLFRALEIGVGPASLMSQELVTLSADLASFNNANPEEVLLALRSGLLGEAEPLRKFGVSLSAARVEAEALASGLVKPVANATKLASSSMKVREANYQAAKALKEHGKDSWEFEKATLAVTKAEEAHAAAAKGSVPQLTAAQKAQAAYAIIQQDTALAQGDFARTSDGLANKQRILSAQFKDFQAKIGAVLIPVLLKVVGVLTDKVFPALSSIGKWLGEHKPVLIAVAGVIGVGLVAAFVSWATAAWAAAAATLAATWPILAIIAVIALLVAGVIYAYKNWGWFRDAVNKVASFMTQTLWPALQRVAGFITGTLIPAVGKIIGKFSDWFAKAREVASGIVAKVQEVVSFVTGVPGKISRAVSGMWSSLQNGLSAVARWIIGKLDSMLGPLDELLGGLGRLKGFALGGNMGLSDRQVKNIIDGQRAAGGPVRAGGTYLVGERGPELFVPGSGGSIVPNHAMGGGVPRPVPVVIELDGQVLGRAMIRFDADHRSRNGRPAFGG